MQSYKQVHSVSEQRDVSVVLDLCVLRRLFQNDTIREALCEVRSESDM